MSIKYGTNENETRIVEFDGDMIYVVDDGKILNIQTQRDFDNWESSEWMACKFNGDFYMKYAFQDDDYQTYELSALNKILEDSDEDEDDFDQSIQCIYCDKPSTNGDICCNNCLPF